jgi:hypothetical protein
VLLVPEEESVGLGFCGPDLCSAEHIYTIFFLKDDVVVADGVSIQSPLIGSHVYVV